MREITLSNGAITLVDDEDYDDLVIYKWRQLGAYAVRAVYLGNHRKQTIYMHKEVLNGPPGSKTDHINGNGLDNRRSNLRVCSNMQNTHNQRRRSSNRSGYRGVHWHKRDMCWQAQLTVNGRRVNLGYHSTAEDAAEAYNKAAVMYYGEFARLNEVKKAS